jgi:hypothetical protein
MTANQIAYMRAEEEARSNIANESLKQSEQDLKRRSLDQTDRQLDQAEDKLANETRLAHANVKSIEANTGLTKAKAEGQMFANDLAKSESGLTGHLFSTGDDSVMYLTNPNYTLEDATELAARADYAQRERMLEHRAAERSDVSADIALSYQPWNNFWGNVSSATGSAANAAKTAGTIVKLLG